MKADEDEKEAEMPKKLTIQDIARLAGVSKSTVSRVLNAKAEVDPATRERILQIIEEHDFVPDIAASRLAGGRSRLIGVLVPSLIWPLIAEIMRGISEVVEQSPYELILYSVTHEKELDEKKQRDVLSRILVSNLASGLLAVYPGPSTAYLTELHEQGFPIVIIDDREKPTSAPWVSADNRTGAYEATRYLLQIGHRRIAYIQGPLEYQAARDRYQGYCEALSEAGLAPDADLVRQGNFTASSGRAIAGYFFSMQSRPTAIFASNDQVAYDVLASAEEYDIQIPGQVSLVGFDDIPLSAYMRPPLTTVRQPFYEMGRQATELLLALVDQSYSRQKIHHPLSAARPLSHALHRAEESPRICLETHLVVRASCRPPQEQAGDSTSALSQRQPGNNDT